MNFFALFLFVELAVNGQVVSPVEARSSPSDIIAIKGSSVWLHWNYTYIGDGRHGVITVTYREQIIGFNSTSKPSIETLAKRTGQNGALALESPVPAPFNGRVGVTSANSTLVIHGLQYNDSTYQYSSSASVVVDAGFGAATNILILKPIVSITVIGMSICHFPLFFNNLLGFHNNLIRFQSFSAISNIVGRYVKVMRKFWIEARDLSPPSFALMLFYKPLIIMKFQFLC